MKDTAGSGGSLLIKSPVRAGFAMSNAVCVTCFHLTDLDGRTSQRCQCQPQIAPDYGMLDCPSGFHLCYICARAESGGWSRWSWNACGRCRDLNASIQKRFGFSLMLGRHSIMNGVSIPFSVKAEEFEVKTQAMIQFAESVTEISDWGNLRARELFESVPEWSQKKFVLVPDWEKKFKSDRKTSLEAFRLYFGVSHLSDLLKKDQNDA
jgi:hypothetical protein